jgi:transcriptional regulator NrdR family protein
MAFQKQILPECPQCKQAGLRVIESRKTAQSTRRRKQCECCGIRFTTHEVSADFYNEAQQNLILVSQMHKLLGSTHTAAEPATIKCTDCIHNQMNACAFDFPEYDTTDSFDCNHYAN